MALHRAGKSHNAFIFPLAALNARSVCSLLALFLAFAAGNAETIEHVVALRHGRRTYTLNTTKTLNLQLNLPAGIVSAPYLGSISATGGVAPYTFTISSGSLPSGLALDASTGTVSGVPSLAGTSNFKLLVTDSTGACLRSHGQIVIGSGASTVSTITLAVSPTSTTLISGATQQFSATVQGTSNTAVVWSASAGTITSTGLFTAPTVSTSTSITILATSSANSSVQASATVAVSPASISVSISPLSASVASGSSQQFSASVQGTSNAGVLWKATTGTISSSGLYTAPVVSTNTSVTVTAVSSANTGTTASAPVTVVAPPPPTTTTIPTLTITSPGTASAAVGSSYSSVFTASGGTAPLSWSVVAGQLPAGLSLASSGTLSGQPTTAGTYTFSVRVLDSGSPQQSATGSITMVIGATLSACNSAPVISNVAYTFSSDSRSITVTWDTNIAADTQLQWGDNDHFGGANSGPADTVTGKTTGHVYTVTGLYPRFQYGIYPRSRCVDSNGPSLNSSYWGVTGFYVTPPMPTGNFQWTAYEYGPHYTFAGYPFYFTYEPVEMQTSNGAGVNWNYTTTVTLPAGWSFTIDSCGSGCSGFAITGNSFTRTQYNGMTEWYVFHLNIPAGTAPGAYTVLVHNVDNTFSTPAQDLSWTVNVLNPATDVVQQAAPPTTFPPIPCQHANSVQANGTACPSTWDSLVNTAFTVYSPIPSGQICTDNTTLPDGYGSSYEALSWYYDGIRGYQQALKYTGNSAFNTCIADAISYMRDRFYLYEATLAGTGQQNWGMGHATFTRGLYADYLATGNANDLAAITDLVTLAPGSGTDMYMVAQNSQREVAYRVEAETVWAQLGHNDRTDLLNRAVAMTIGTLDESCVSQNTDFGALPSSVQPMFIGLAADALIYYYNAGHQNDIRIPWAIKKCADWMWNNAWVGQPLYAGGPDHYWDYLTDTRQKLGSDSDYRGLNPLIFPIYAWLFKYTGNATIPGSDGSQCYGTPGQPCTYQQAGDAAFSSAMSTAGNLTTWGWLWGGKSYTQSTRWGFDYINWRNGQ